jgi:hypothetical protein
MTQDTLKNVIFTASDWSAMISKRSKSDSRFKYTETKVEAAQSREDQRAARKNKKI